MSFWNVYITNSFPLGKFSLRGKVLKRTNRVEYCCSATNFVKKIVNFIFQILHKKIANIMQKNLKFWHMVVPKYLEFCNVLWGGGGNHEFIINDWGNISWSLANGHSKKINFINRSQKKSKFLDMIVGKSQTSLRLWKKFVKFHWSTHNKHHQ